MQFTIDLFLIKIKLHTCFLFLVFAFAVNFSQAQIKSSNIQTIEGKKFYIHKIEKSQSLYAISKLYNTSIDNLYLVNPELKSGAKAGQEIKIPVTPLNATLSSSNTPTSIVSPNAVTVDTNKYLTHKILKGETVYSISKKYNLNEKQLNTYNPALVQGLKEGQLLIVGEKQKKKPAKDLKEIKPAVAAKEPKTLPPAIDSSLFKPVSKPKKNSYTIALILPFRADQTLAMDLGSLSKSSSGFPPIPALAVDFYLGFKRAMDSLSGNDFKINLELFDIDDKDSAKLVQLANNPKFKELDFIFGPLYANGFKSISKKAKEFNIPIVSPITTQNKILYNNNYISKTNPSQFTLLEGLADYCMDSLMTGNSNLILVNSEKDKKEIAFVNAFKKYYNERQKALGKNIKDSVHVVKGIAGVKSVFHSNLNNVVVMLSNNQAFAADFTTQLALYADKKNCVLCGWQNISENDNIDQEYLNQLNYTFPHPYNLVNTASYKSVIDWYRSQQDSYPGEYYFIGFDIALYYLKNLKITGPDFVHQLNGFLEETNYMRFKFTRPDLTTGFDNRGMYIFKYKDYQLYKTGWK